MKYFRGIETISAEEQQSTPMKQVKIEFDNIKSLINEGKDGKNEVAVKDFSNTSFDLRLNHAKFKIDLFFSNETSEKSFDKWCGAHAVRAI